MSDKESTPENEQYRTCAQCGTDCLPEPIEADDGFKIAFVCAEHGVHSIVDPFKGSR